MAIHKTEVFVIKKQDFRETSIIVNFYTRDFGKISGILKGIRGKPAKFASTLEPFSHNEIVFYRKTNSSLHLVSECDIKDVFSPIREHMSKVGTASLMMELLDALMPLEDKNEEVFDLTFASLKELETNNDPDKIMIIFKIKILAFSGFKPNFDSCVSCGSRIISQSRFSLALGGLLCANCYMKDLKSRIIFRGTIASIQYIQRNNFKNNLNLGMNPQIKKELIFVLNSFLNFNLGKRLKSERVLNNLNNLEKIKLASPVKIFSGGQ